MHYQTVTRGWRIPVNAAQPDAHGGVLVVVLLLFRRVHFDKAAIDRMHVILLVGIPGAAVVPGAGAKALSGKVVGESRRRRTLIRVLVGVVRVRVLIAIGRLPVGVIRIVRVVRHAIVVVI